MKIAKGTCERHAEKLINTNLMSLNLLYLRRLSFCPLFFIPFFLFIARVLRATNGSGFVSQPWLCTKFRKYAWKRSQKVDKMTLRDSVMEKIS
jgi:hypothetical protein